MIRLKDLWSDSETQGMDEPELLRYRSNLLGSDLRLTNFGGGNTSAKVKDLDPITGEEVEVLWVKGSGGDLGTIRRDGFATLYMDRLLALKNRYRGAEFEDEMVDLYPLCTFGVNPRAASIDTPLHAFLPYKHVDHLHPDWAIAVAAAANGPAHVDRIREETGLKLVWLPWKRPGFEWGLWLEKVTRENPDADGIVLGSHGLFTWGDTSRNSYVQTLRVVDAIGEYVIRHVEEAGEALFGGPIHSTRTDHRELAAALLPMLRGEAGPAIGHFDDQPEVLRFVNSARAEALAWQGTSCPDHFVRTKVRPLFVPWDPAAGNVETLKDSVRAAIPQYRKAYDDYYNAHKQPDSPAIRSSSPSVVLVPGVGMFTLAKSKSEARITAEFYINAIHVMEGATALADSDGRPQTTDGRTHATRITQHSPESIITPNAQRPTPSIVDNYVSLDPREAFNIEYWSLEEAKLRRMPPEMELSRKVAVVIGASPGIGRAIAVKLAKEGAHVVIADLHPHDAEESAEQVRQAAGKETGLADSVDCTDRQSVRALLQRTSLAYGGIDILVQTAAVFFPPADDGRITEDQWRKTLDVNLLGSAVAADEAYRIMAEQGTGGSVVLLSSANAVVPKKGSWAYDAGKAGLNHLVRELAIEFAPSVRVNAVAPASVVEGSIQFPRERVMSSLTKYGIAFDESESTESLRHRLSEYYAERTLLKQKVSPTNVAEAVFLLVSDRLSLTTGHILPVDAGLPDAFLR